MARCAVNQSDLLLLCLGERIAQTFRLFHPVRCADAMDEDHVNVLGLQESALIVESGDAVFTFAQTELGHQPIRVARNALQSDAEHLRHALIGLRGFEKADAAIVRMAHQPGELFLPEFSLDAAAMSAGPECEPGDLNARVPEFHPVGCGSFGCEGRGGSHRADRARRCLKEVASAEMRHSLLLTANVSHLQSIVTPER